MSRWPRWPSRPEHGIALAGLPFTRYIEMGPGLVTMEPGMPVTGSVTSSHGEVMADTLPGVPAATTMHTGPYDKLSDAYAAIEQWMETEGLVAAGAPWESSTIQPIIRIPRIGKPRYSGPLRASCNCGGE